MRNNATGKTGHNNQWWEEYWEREEELAVLDESRKKLFEMGQQSS